MFTKTKEHIWENLIEHNNEFFLESNFEDKRIYQNVYKKCRFKNFTFRNIEFYDVEFIECEFNNVTFDNCKFSGVDEFYINNSMLEKVLILNSKLPRIMIRDCYIECTINNSVIENAVLETVELSKLQLIGKCDLRGTQILDIRDNFKLLVDEKESSILLNEDTEIGRFKVSKDNEYFKYESDYYLERIVNSYRIFSRLFKMNDIYDNYSKCSFYSKLYNRKRLRGLNKVVSFLEHISCGYGDRWYYGLISWSAVILIFSFIYFFNGLIVPEVHVFEGNILTEMKLLNHNILSLNRNLIFSKVIRDFGTCLYFSMMTFTTVGYGNIEAYGIISKVFSFFEMGIGVIMMATITGAILRKILR